MKHKAKTFFDEEKRLDRLAKKQDPLDPLRKKVNWLIFKTILENAFRHDPNGAGGRPRYDLILMFKILVLQKLYNLSDEQMEYQILDRLSFMRFLELELQDDVPDQNTIWNFREMLTRKEKIKTLFNKFNDHLKDKGLIAQDGMIVDASFIEVPIQRNNRDDNQVIKNGKIPEEWSEKKLSHKDVDARWTKKNDESYYGYKNHVKANNRTKLIEEYSITDASVHDSLMLFSLLKVSDRMRKLWADSAYFSAWIQQQLEKHEIISLIHEKGYRGKPLTKKQMRDNHNKSKVRVLVEHIFGHMEIAMGGMKIRSIGIKRAMTNIGLMNLAYNISRSLLYA